ncbi:hypothetical protein BVX95_01485 [archaeon D22]|nr:hypothetical protein BVX95_01485 [archaeon D22]
MSTKYECNKPACMLGLVYYSNYGLTSNIEEHNPDAEKCPYRISDISHGFCTNQDVLKALVRRQIESGEAADLLKELLKE